MACGRHLYGTMNLVEEARRMAPSLSRGTPFTYILRLRSGILYTGCSTDFETRFQEHTNGTACHTTQLDPPSSLLWVEIQPDLSIARKREAQIKKWSRGKKEALVSGNPDRLRSLSKSRKPGQSSFSDHIKR
jgi:predicted GIY-YIG superfamily endonuclease